MSEIAVRAELENVVDRVNWEEGRIPESQKVKTIPWTEVGKRLFRGIE